jgi:hypothetical protein
MAADTPRNEAHPPAALPVGAKLGEFEVLGVLGIGGFGIVYLALDHALEREVAVKEYMPASLAGRTETMHVSLRSQSDAETFELGRRSFVNEARLLARFDHPSLLKVHQFWEANGTAYMAMPVYRGRTLKEVRRTLAQPPDEAWLRALLEPLLGAIEKLHDAGVFHRDIAPDNIVIEPDGRPVLLDFGAARRVIGDKSQALTAILKPAYAPIEQYGEAGSVKQGPWTDIYALGATLHFMLLGRPPSPATARAVNDDQRPLAGQALPGCSAEFLEVIDWMLSPRPADRPQSVAALRNALAGSASMSPAAAPAAGDATQGLDAASVAQPVTPEEHRAEARTIVAPAPTAPAPTVAAPAAPTAPAAPAPAPLPPAPASAGLRWAWVGLAGVAVAAVAGYFVWPRDAAEPAAGRVAASAPDGGTAAAPRAAPSTPIAKASGEQAPVRTAIAPALADVEKPEPKAVQTTIAAPEPRREPRTAPQPAARPPAPRPPAEAPAPALAQKPLPADVAPAFAEAPKPRTLAAPTTPTPAAAPVAVTAEPVAVVGPVERCGRRVLLALWLCVQRECAKPELYSHPECVKWRAEEARRANPNR